MTTELQERFDLLAARFFGEASVTEGTGFGKSRGLRVRGRIFAIFGADSVTVKLPRGRVDALVTAGTGERFDPGHGRIMREWLTVHASHTDEWDGLAEEALAYVGSIGDR